MKKVGPPSEEHTELTLRFLDAAKPSIDPLQASLHDHPGCVADITLRGFIGSTLLNELADRKSTLVSVWSTLHRLPAETKISLGIDPEISIEYHQVHRIFSRICEKLSGTDNTVDDLTEFLTRLCEHMMDDEPDINWGTIGIFDGTVVETPAKVHFRKKTAKEKAASKPKDRDKEIAYSADPDALHGHYPSKGGKKAGFAMGFEAHLFANVPVADEPAPLIATAIAVVGNSTATRVIARDLAISRKHRFDTVIYDAGYGFTDKRTFARLEEVGIDRIFDPSGKRRDRSTHNGARILDGDAFCPSVPETLVKLKTNTNLKDSTKSAALAEQYDERARYAFQRHGSTESQYRFKCPARAGKVRCPHYAPSMEGDLSRPVIDNPPNDGRPSCTQATITVPKKTLGTNRQSRFLFGTTKWLAFYRKRGRVESANSNFRHNLTTLAERKWIQVMGRLKLGFFLGMKILVANMLSIDRFRDREPN